jgi:hypothetical protein
MVGVEAAIVLTQKLNGDYQMGTLGKTGMGKILQIE